MTLDRTNRHTSQPNKWRLQRIARSTTKKPIRLDYHPIQSMTDGKNVFISTQLIGDEDITLIVQTGSTYHESYHILFTDFEALKDTITEPSSWEDVAIDGVIDMFGNIFEDCRIEAAAKSLFKGATMYLQMKNFALLEFTLKEEMKKDKPEYEHIVHVVTSQAKFGHVPKRYVNPKRELRFIRRIAPVVETAVTAKNTKELRVWAEIAAYEFMKWYPGLVKEQVEQMKKSLDGLVLMIVGNAPPGCQPIDVDITEPINAIIIILEDPESGGSPQDGPPINVVEILDLRDEKEDQDGEEGDDSQSGTSQSGDETEGEMEGDVDGESEGGDEGEDDEDSRTSNESRRFSGDSEERTPGEEMIDSHPELAPETKRQMKQMMRQAKEGVERDMRIHEKAEEKLSKQDQKYTEVGNITQVGDNHKVNYERSLERDIDAYRDIKAEWSKSATTIANKIRNLLLDAKAARKVRNLPSGDLDRRSLYRVETSTSLFSRVEIPQVKDSVFTILVDHSLSMDNRCDVGYGRKDKWASTACIVVAEILSKIPDIDFEIIGFNGWSGHQTYFLYKSYGEPYDDRVKGALAVPKASTGNVDAAALEVAVARQDTMPQPQKIIVVISDGNPTNSPYRGMSGQESLKHALEKFRKRKIVGIGITGGMKYTPADFYKHYVIVKDVRRLPWELVTIIRKLLRR